MSGKFITLEGGEGAGKSTQAGLLHGALEARGIDVVRTREPGGSAGAEEIRGLLVGGDPGRWDARCEALLVTAARRDHLLRTIWPALERGAWVISDRYADSTLAYQGHAGGVATDELDALYGFAAGDFRPDLTLVFDLPVEIGLERARRRSAGAAGAEDRFERKGRAFHDALRAGFAKIVAAEPGRCALIDATRSVDAIHADVLKLVRERLGAPV